MTDVIRLPDIEPDNWEIIEMALTHLCLHGDDEVSNDNKRLAEFTLEYLKRGLKVY